MSKEEAVMILYIMNLIMAKGVPAFIRWKDGTKLEDPTLEEVEALADRIKPPQTY